MPGTREKQADDMASSNLWNLHFFIFNRISVLIPFFPRGRYESFAELYCLSAVPKCIFSFYYICLAFITFSPICLIFSICMLLFLHFLTMYIRMCTHMVQWLNPRYTLTTHSRVYCHTGDTRWSLPSSSHTHEDFFIFTPIGKPGRWSADGCDRDRLWREGVGPPPGNLLLRKIRRSSENSLKQSNTDTVHSVPTAPRRRVTCQSLLVGCKLICGTSTMSKWLGTYIYHIFRTFLSYI